MNKLLAILSFITAIGLMAVTFPEGITAVLLVVVCSFIVILIIRRTTENSEFLINLFLIALFIRLLLGTVTYLFGWEEFFGGDSTTYDYLANTLLNYWTGIPNNDEGWTLRAISTSQPGWGMTYITAFIYMICGRSMLVGQFFCAVIGAATVPMVYNCSYEIFNNQRVSKLSAVMVALFPTFIVWSSQLLKDGLIIFLLVLTMTMVLKLQKRFSYVAIITLAFCLFGILALRFYIFYIVGVAVAGSFIIGSGSSIKSIVRGFISLACIGAVLIYIGALQSAGTSFEKYGTMERMQASRLDNAKTANSGFNEDIDISTPMGALAAMPLGFVYLMFAPFPWQISNFRQAVTLPEMVVWWFSLPFLISGLRFTIKNKLRNSISILLFSLMLTLAYSVFQGNVGTAYRQRAQIQVFLFIFIAVGWTLVLERRENSRLSKNLKQPPKKLGHRVLGTEEVTN